MKALRKHTARGNREIRNGCPGIVMLMGANQVWDYWGLGICAGKGEDNIPGKEREGQRHV